MAAQLEILQKRNVVILGRTGTGKKTIANQILAKDVFHVQSSMESVTRQATTMDAEEKDPIRKVHYNIKIIDTVGPYSAPIEKQTIFRHIIDYSTTKVPEGINLILFTFRNGVYEKGEIEAFKAIIKSFKDEIREMSALVITGCESFDEIGRKNIIQEINTEEGTSGIARFMGKGVHLVGFPSLTNVNIALKEEYKRGIASDAKELRKLIMGAGEMTLNQDIIRRKLDPNMTGKPQMSLLEQLWNSCNLL
ncbi:hypothetical protein QZH41_001543 [Actinostola sp. cb2023]|nr:hypothetical protein QZH41_001543 [Actinostola sp. cb2023]